MEDYEIALNKWVWNKLSDFTREELEVNSWKEIKAVELDARSERSWDTFGSIVYDLPAEIHVFGKNRFTMYPYRMDRPGLAQMIFELLNIEITEEDRN